MNKLKFLKMSMLFVCAGVLTACGQQEISDRKKDINEIYNQAIQNYEVIQEDSSEGYEICVNVPDLIAIYDEISGHLQETDVEIDKEVIEKYPDLEKKYIFNVPELEDEFIKEAFLQQITGELMCEAIKQTVITEEWSVEE